MSRSLRRGQNANNKVVTNPNNLQMKTQSGVSMQTQINNLFHATKHHTGGGDDISSQQTDTFCFDTHSTNNLNKTTKFNNMVAPAASLASKSTAFASTIQNTKGKDDKNATAMTAKAIMDKLMINKNNKTPTKNSRQQAVAATKENKPKRAPSAVSKKSGNNSSSSPVINAMSKTKRGGKKRTVKQAFPNDISFNETQKPDNKPLKKRKTNKNENASEDDLPFSSILNNLESKSKQQKVDDQIIQKKEKEQEIQKEIVQKPKEAPIQIGQQLSSSTADLLRKLKNKDTNSTNQQRQSSKNSKLETEFTFDGLEKFDENRKRTKQKQQKIQLSKQTQNILNELKIGKAKDEEELTTAVADKPKRLLESPLPSQQQSMLYKHSQLLQVTRELVMPAHFKVLLDVCSFIDNQLDFMIQARKKSSGLFNEIVKSIERTHGRSVTLDQFKQLLSVVPEFYEHTWEGKGRDWHLSISFAQNFNTSKDERLNILRQRLLNKVIESHDQFLSDNPELRSQLPADYTPLKYNQWHHEFNPHTQVQQISTAELKPQQKGLMQKSESIQNFLNQASQRHNLVKNAIDKSRLELQQQELGEEDIDQNTSADLQAKKEHEQLVAMSKKTGLSIETLKLVKTKQDAINQTKIALEKSQNMEEIHRQKQIVPLQKLAESIRNVLNYKRLNAITLQKLCQELAHSDTGRGQFSSAQERESSIRKLAQLVPEWIQLKLISGRGLFVKCQTQKLSCHRVNELIQQRVGSFTQSNNQ